MALRNLETIIRIAVESLLTTPDGMGSMAPQSWKLGLCVPIENVVAMNKACWLRNLGCCVYILSS